MVRKKLLAHIIALMLFLFLMDKGANKFYWYNLIWYFDMIMHFLSGIWVGLFFLYVFNTDHFDLRSFLKIVCMVLLIGVAWEIFEFIVNNVIGRVPFDPIDTLSDIFWDILGGSVAVFYLFKIIMPTSENKIQ